MKRSISKDVSKAFLLTASLIAIGSAGTFGAASFLAFQDAAREVERVASGQLTALLDIEQLRTASERIGRTARAYLLTRDPRFLGEMQEAQASFARIFQKLEGEVPRPEEEGLMRELREAAAQHDRAYAPALDLPIGASLSPEVSAAIEQAIQPARDQLDGLLASLRNRHDRDFREWQRATSEATTGRARRLILAAVLSSFAALFAVFWLSGALSALADSRRKLEESMRALSRANEDLDAFTGRVAHDVQGALAPIVLGLAVLRRSAGDANKVERLSSNLEASSRRATSLVQALLSFARAGGGDRMATAHVPTVVQGVVSDHGGRAAEVRATLVAEAEDCEVRCAPELLYVVLANVVGNAIKFVEGSPVRCISLRAFATDSHCELVVDDTGPGITAEARAKAFEPFFRASSGVPGNGIGLATVKRVVEARRHRQPRVYRGHGHDRANDTSSRASLVSWSWTTHRRP